MENIKRKRVIQHDIISHSPKLKKENELSYVLIDKRFLDFDDHYDFNLFFHNNPTQMTLFLQSDTIINSEQRQKLNQIEQLYISDSQKHEYEHFLEEHLQSILKQESLSMDEKTELIYTTTTDLTLSLYENPDALENAQQSEKIVTPILDSILNNENTISSYVKIIEYDYYTHTHSLNVSIYSLCLGVELGLNEEELFSLGNAALLHDLGKSKIEHDIINKDGILTKEEFERIKRHPALGYDIAVRLGIDKKNILDGIRHHHEKLNGFGYPDGLKDSEISLFPRIIGICDVFDALNSRRSYKAAMRSFEALQLMKTEMQEHLDMKILNIFIKMLHK